VVPAELVVASLALVELLMPALVKLRIDARARRLVVRCPQSAPARRPAGTPLYDASSASVGFGLSTETSDW
jgi:hypothetical protein